MFRSILLLSCVGVLALSGSGCRKRTNNESDVADAWNAENNPANFGPQVVRKYASLPKSNHLSREPWSETYWPNNAGGVALRWARGGRDNSWSYRLYGKDELKKLDDSEMKTLSPAEKYDIFMGRYDYPTVKRERAKNKPSDLGWFGICHAWAPASLHWEEPKPVTVTNADGIRIPFASSDIKGLISLGYDMAQQYPDYHRVGLRNYGTTGAEGRGSQTAANDTNAGAFHVVLTNFTAPGKSGLVMDAYNEDQVWNHPIYSYRVDERRRRRGASAGAAPGTVEEVTVETVVRYAVETPPQWNPRISSGSNAYTELKYEYTLELDREGNIIGGEWVSKIRPDFVWMSAIPDFNVTVSGVNLAGINDLYKKSLNRTTTPAPVATAPTGPNPGSNPGTNPGTNPGQIQEVEPPRPTRTNCPTIDNFPDCFHAWPVCQWLRIEKKCVVRQ